MLGARAQDVVRVAEASIAFRGGLGWTGLILLLMLIGAAVWWLYRSRFIGIQLSNRKRTILTALRVVFMGLLLFLLLRPVLALTIEGTIRRTLVVLIDSSTSMQIKDPVARIEHAKAVLKNEQLKLLPSLFEAFDIEPFTFGQALAALDNPGRPALRGAELQTAQRFSWIDSLTASNSATALGDALREILNRKRGQPLAGVFLLTDGANNSGSEPRAAAELFKQEGVPLYTYGVGARAPRDIIVANVLGPDVAFLKDEVAVTVRVRSQGLQGQTGTLALRLGTGVVATASLVFSNNMEDLAVPLKFTPQAAGDFELLASIEPRSDEAVRDNNSQSHRLRVIDQKIKVLLADQSPRWEFRYLQAMLLRDRRVALKCFLAEGDPAISRGENTPYLVQFPASKEELFKYDLVILGDLNPRTISLNQIDLLNQHVSDFGGALIMIAGRRYAPTAYRNTALQKLLPIDLSSAAQDLTMQRVQDFTPAATRPTYVALTSAGRASPMLRLSEDDEENVRLWKEMSPLYWTFAASRAKPAAEVLLVNSDAGREGRVSYTAAKPLLVTHRYGLGQVLFVGTDNTWRWRKNIGDRHYTTFWGQIVQRLSLARMLGSSKRTQLTTDRQQYRVGDRVSIYGRLYGIGFDPRREPVINGFLQVEPGENAPAEVTLRGLPDQPGLYRGEFVAVAPGRYRFWVEHDPAAAIDVTVVEPRFEFGETAMNEPLLREIARISGGAFFGEEDLPKVPQTIRQQTERVRSPLEVELWSSPLYFLLLLGVVSTEWILRKRWYLK